MKSVHSDYFEGILQLRNPSNNVRKFVRKSVGQKKDVFISKEVKVKNGWDVYLSSQHFLQTLGKMLQKNFGGEMVVSAKLFTKNRQTSKEVYRVNVLFRVPSFSKGDIITHRGDRLKVLFLGKKVGVKNLETGKKTQLSYTNLR